MRALPHTTTYRKYRRSRTWTPCKRWASRGTPVSSWWCPHTPTTWAAILRGSRFRPTSNRGVVLLLIKGVYYRRNPCTITRIIGYYIFKYVVLMYKTRSLFQFHSKPNILPMICTQFIQPNYSLTVATLRCTREINSHEHFTTNKTLKSIRLYCKRSYSCDYIELLNNDYHNNYYKESKTVVIACRWAI